MQTLSWYAIKYDLPLETQTDAVYKVAALGSSKKFDFSKLAFGDSDIWQPASKMALNVPYIVVFQAPSHAE